MPLLHEETARTSWCPFTRVKSMIVADAGNIIQASGCNRIYKEADGSRELIADEQLPGSFCIASDCMAWRWQKNSDDLLATEEPMGFCGLAGRPE